MRSSSEHDDTDGGHGLDTATMATRKSVLRSTIPYLLWNEFGERLAFYGLVTNLIIYLSTVMGQKTVAARPREMPPMRKSRTAAAEPLSWPSIRRPIVSTSP